MEEGGFSGVVRVVVEDGDVAVWMLAVDEAGARRDLDAEALGADGDAAVEDGGSQAPDVGPPRAKDPEPADGQRGAGRRAERFSFEPKNVNGMSTKDTKRHARKELRRRGS